MDEQKTLKNLMEAFAGESQANRKYLKIILIFKGNPCKILRGVSLTWQ